MEPIPLFPEISTFHVEVKHRSSKITKLCIRAGQNEFTSFYVPVKLDSDATFE
jgi:hypothetical protein